MNCSCPQLWKKFVCTDLHILKFERYPNVLVMTEAGERTSVAHSLEGIFSAAGSGIDKEEPQR